MKKYIVKLIRKEEAAFKTFSFYFEKPEGFSFKAGQYLKLSLLQPKEQDFRGNVRSFSIASLPEDPFLMVTMRIRRSPFKNELLHLPAGSEVEIQGPITMLNLKNDDKTVLFLTGGVGAAAARPMILGAIKEGRPGQIYFFNSNRNKKDISFFKEFFQVQKSNFKYIPNLTKKSKEDSDWAGERGYITESLIKKYVENPGKAIYFLIGPSVFMWSMYKLIKGMGIKDNQISFDEYTGY